MLAIKCTEGFYYITITMDKSWYSNFFREKRMMDEMGQKLPSHPNFGFTPVRMTRSKTSMKKQKTVGFYCDKCHKTLKNVSLVSQKLVFLIDDLT